MKLTFLLPLTGLLITAALLGFWPSTGTGSVREAENPEDVPRELGTVRWIRGFEKAMSRARSENKPVLILFQEVPGCATCVGYGQEVLSNPLIVEALEELFIPLAVYNNIPGDDRATLSMFNEPAWNNPVVRVISADKKELAPRLAGDYTQVGLVRTMVEALKKIGGNIPSYLALLHEELDLRSHSTETATFAMYCFWTGEAELGSLNGVLSTKPGFLKGREVVEVEFDPSRISYGDLVRNAHSRECATTVFSRSASQQAIAAGIVGNDAEFSSNRIRPDNEPKYYLSKTLLRFLPMTTLQQNRVNSAIGKGGDALALLSSRQLQMLEYIKQHPGQVWKSQIGSSELRSSWNDLTSRMNSVMSDVR